MLISDDYREMNRRLHEAVPEWGTGGVSQWFIPFIKGFDSILDYGCGKGKTDIRVPDLRRYDPAIPKFAAPPDPADLVLCDTVLEHIDPDCLDDVLDHIKSLARKRVVIKITTEPSTFMLADGKNAHRIIQPANWWLERLLPRWRFLFGETTPRGLRFVGV